MKKIHHLFEDNLNHRESNLIKTISENVKNFSFEDYSKFFQVMSNLQHISQLDSNLLSKNKDIITINEKLINFNDRELDLDSDREEKNINKTSINKLIVRKEIPLKALLKDKDIKLNEENHELHNGHTVSNLNEIPFKNFFEELIENLKRNSDVPKDFLIKKMIKVYTTYVFHKHIIKFDKEDKFILDYIIESNPSIENFYSICSFWLYEEYLLSEMTNDITLKRRYDSILNEILSRAEQYKNMFELEKCKECWVDFIQNIPQYNDKSIEHIHLVNEEIMKQYDSQLKKVNKTQSLEEQLPHLKLMHFIYVKIRKNLCSNIKNLYNLNKETTVNYQNICDKILSKFLDLLKSSDTTFISLAIKFLRDFIYPISDHEKTKLKEHAVTQFKELQNVKESTLTDNYIKNRYPLYFHLCRYDQELIFHLPTVYAECPQIVKNVLDKHLKLIIKGLDMFNTVKLISLCNEQCLKIVLEIIENLKIESLKNVQEEKLIRAIKKFYEENDFIEILVSLSEKFNIHDFLNSFIFDKIKYFDNLGNSENPLKIFNKINNIKNESIDTENFNSYSDKLMLYISHLVINNSTISEKHNNSDLRILIKYYKLLKTEKWLENISTLFDKLIKKLQSGHEIIFINTINIFYENYKENKEIIKLLLSKKIQFLTYF